MPPKKSDKYCRPRSKWKLRDALIVSRKPENPEVLKLLIPDGSELMLIVEDEYVDPGIPFRYVMSTVSVSLKNEDWWDDMRMRSADQRIHLL